MYDVIIVGGGPAGLTAAIYAHRAGLDTLILEGSEVGGQVAISAEIENYPGTPGATGRQLAEAMDRQVRAMDIPIRREKVLGITGGGPEKQVSAGEHIYTGRTLILANGVKRRKLNCPGEAELLGRGVSYCAACDGAFFRGRDVIVVGGGNTALEDAVYLAGICRSVRLVFRRGEPTAQRALVTAAKAKENLQFCPHSRVQRILGDGAVESVALIDAEDREQPPLPVSGVFIAIGLIPDNGIFAPPVALDEAGYILAGEDCKTNCPGIFCAGDTRRKPLRQIVTAAADGAVAAMQAERFLAGAT